MNKYDCIIIGGGPAGYKAAEKLADLKKSVCIVEAKESNMGGTCLNEGCVPVKSLLESAEVYGKIKNASEFGIDFELKPVDMEKIQEVMKKNISQLKTGLLSLLKSKGVNLIFGKASFVTENKIEVALEKGGNEELQADCFIIATGAVPKKLPEIEVDGEYIFDSSQLVKSCLLPENLLIIGGGYIGCEFASLYNKLGSKVTVVEVCHQLLPGEDTEVSRTLLKEFEKQGIEVFTERKISGITKSDLGINVTIEDTNKCIAEVLTFDRILIAAGRVPNTSVLNLRKAGIRTENGFIPVDKSMKTNIEHIYAAGDVINTPMLAHTAYREGIIAAESIAGVNKTGINYNAVPRIVFSSPQVGCIGMTREKAEENGVKIGISKRFFKANAKAVILKQDTGFAKIIFNTETREVLGVCIIGPGASELVHVLSSAVEKKLTIDEIDRIVYGHPTLSEILILS